MDVDGREPLESRLKSLDESLGGEIVELDVSLSLEGGRVRGEKRRVGTKRSVSSNASRKEEREETKEGTHDDEEVRFGRVEGNLLDESLGLLEGGLGHVLGELMDQNRLVGTLGEGKSEGEKGDASVVNFVALEKLNLRRIRKKEGRLTVRRDRRKVVSLSVEGDLSRSSRDVDDDENSTVPLRIGSSSPTNVRRLGRFRVRGSGDGLESGGGGRESEVGVEERERSDEDDLVLAEGEGDEREGGRGSQSSFEMRRRERAGE